MSLILPTTIEPSSPALTAIWRAGVLSAFLTISIPVFWSSFSAFSRLSALMDRRRATPPPGRMPSSTAARGSRAWHHRPGPCAPLPRPPSHRRRGFTATPPASLANRSCNFSRSWSEVVSSICEAACTWVEKSQRIALSSPRGQTESLSLIDRRDVPPEIW